MYKDNSYNPVIPGSFRSSSRTWSGCVCLVTMLQCVWDQIAAFPDIYHLPAPQAECHRGWDFLTYVCRGMCNLEHKVNHWRLISQQLAVTNDKTSIWPCQLENHRDFSPHPVRYCYMCQRLSSHFLVPDISRCTAIKLHGWMNITAEYIFCMALCIIHIQKSEY